MKKIGDLFERYYNELYNNHLLEERLSYLAYLHDFLMNDSSYMKDVVRFNEWRGDFISSDREAMAYVLAYMNVKGVHKF